jgi:hypothetical protein
MGRAPIPFAMIGLLTALPGTQLWRRLAAEGRLLGMPSGELLARTNFVTRLDEATLLEGYADLLAEVYSPAGFFARAERTLALCPQEKSRFRGRPRQMLAWLARSLWTQGVRAAYRGEYWRFLGRVLRYHRARLPRAIGLAILGEHLIRYTARDVVPGLRRAAVEARRTPRVAGAPAEEGPLVALRGPIFNDAGRASGPPHGPPWPGGSAASPDARSP